LYSGIATQRLGIVTSAWESLPAVGNRYPVPGNRYPALRKSLPSPWESTKRSGSHNFQCFMFIDWKENGDLTFKPDLPLEFFSTNNPLEKITNSNETLLTFFVTAKRLKKN